MDHIQALSCPPEIQQALCSSVGDLKALLGDRLRAIYLYGSLARGCFNVATSDVDTIVVLSSLPAEEEMAGILSVYQRVGFPFDPVFVTVKQVAVDAFPPPVAFLVKSLADGPMIIYPEGGTRSDFLLDRQDAYEAGIALFGPPPAELLHPVPWPLLVESLDYLFPYLVTHFKNPVLMLCRMMYAFTFRRLCGKAQAGAWAVTAIGEHWRVLIYNALADYREGVRRPLERATGEAFARACADYLSLVRNR